MLKLYELCFIPLGNCQFKKIRANEITDNHFQQLDEHLNPCLLN